MVDPKDERQKHDKWLSQQNFEGLTAYERVCLWHGWQARAAQDSREEVPAKMTPADCSNEFKAGRLFQFRRMKLQRPIDPVYWDAHEEKELSRAPLEDIAPEQTQPTQVTQEYNAWASRGEEEYRRGFLAGQRERALKEFHLRWKKDAESDGETLPITKQLENAFLEGWDAGRKSVEK